MTETTPIPEAPVESPPVVESAPIGESQSTISPITDIVEHAEAGRTIEPEIAYNLMLSGVSEFSGNKPQEVVDTVGNVATAYGLLAGEQQRFPIGRQAAVWERVNRIRDDEASVDAELHREGYSTNGLTLTDEESAILAKLARASNLYYNPRQKEFSFASVPDRQTAKKLIQAYWEREAQEYWAKQPEPLRKAHQDTAERMAQEQQAKDKAIREIEQVLDQAAQTENATGVQEAEDPRKKKRTP